MPPYELAFPDNITNLKLSKGQKDYVSGFDDALFVRAGENGDCQIIPIFGGDEFTGEVLEGSWVKNWSTSMDADQAFTAILNGSGILNFKGEADVAGTLGSGYINNKHIIPILDGTEIAIAMHMPVADSGAVASRDLYFEFYICKTKVTSSPLSEANWIRIRLYVDENGYISYIQFNTDGSTSTKFSGSTYDDASTQDDSTIDLYTIWRLVFDGKPGEEGSVLHVYLRQSETFEDAENAVERELTTSPYDTNDLRFDSGYPCLRIGSENTSYFDDGSEAQVDYIRVEYPDFNAEYEIDEADRFTTDVTIWDGDPDNGGVQVYDIDHVFASDVYLQNGLMQLHVDEGIIRGMKMALYRSGAWDDCVYEHSFRLQSDSQTAQYPYFDSVLYISPEKVVVRVKWCEDAVDDEDYYVLTDITLLRGSYLFEINPVAVVPNQDMYYYYSMQPIWARFAYVGDDYIGDDDLNISATNTTMTDNFAIVFDNDGDEKLGVVCLNIPPDDDFRTYEGRGTYFRDIVYVNMLRTKIYIGIIPFDEVAYLFIEAEDATLGSGASAAVDATASNGEAALLNAFGEYVRTNIITNLQVGRYLAVARMKDTNQVASDCEFYVYNSTDGVFRNEENAKAYLTLTADWVYYSLVFDVTEDDNGDTFYIEVRKGTGGANSIYVDYFLVIPIGNGESYPQDLAHSAMRDKKMEIRRFLK